MPKKKKKKKKATTLTARQAAKLAKKLSARALRHRQNHQRMIVARQSAFHHGDHDNAGIYNAMATAALNKAIVLEQKVTRLRNGTIVS